MKNMRVSRKILVSFMIVLAIAMAVGGVGIIGMNSLNTACNELSQDIVKPLPNLARAMSIIQRIRVNVREYTIAAQTNDQESIESTRNIIEGYKTDFVKYVSEYNVHPVNADDSANIEDALRLFNGEYSTYLENSYKLAKAGENEQLADLTADFRATLEKIVGDLDNSLEINIEEGGKYEVETDVLFSNMLKTIIAALVVAAVVAILIALYISGLISKPLVVLTRFMQKAGSTGDIEITAEDREIINQYAQVKDEIGQTIGATVAFVGHVTEIGKALETIAGGDLTISVRMLSEDDTMGRSLDTMLNNLNNMFSEINAATGQVSAGSKQIADGAQALAAGSTEQASSVEELAASLSEVSTKTNENAEMAKEASGLSGEIKGNAEKGSVQMEQMMTAVNEINEASGSISKVIKVIDDIAFQTNILALNAAVEAARAGQHGKGFAVVAEEVRNLAAKSAEAAKDTSSLIENSIEKANFGMTIATETSASLQGIVEGINRNAEIIIKIEESSEEQSKAITQINVGIDQVAQVVQQNSATAEESAAASEELSGQADMLEQLISQFKLKA